VNVLCNANTVAPILKLLLITDCWHKGKTDFFGKNVPKKDFDSPQLGEDKKQQRNSHSKHFFLLQLP
jgi:hypothetical protein